MISYDKYQNRIKRVAAVKNFIVRFRALFITLFAVLIAASLALMFTKGMITKSIILPDKIVYGDDYGSEIQQPKAFLSGVEYQFKRIKDENDAKSAAKYSLTDDEVSEETEEEEWTHDLPTYAGRYLVRMVTNKIFGKSYSTPKEFEIETKHVDFVITGNSVIYGEMPKEGEYEFTTVKGDNFDKDAVRFKYEDPAADSTVVWADKDSFRIYNSKGEDVTFCYDISVPKTEEQVKIEQKEEKITPVSLQTEYIGGEIDYENGVFHLKGGDAYIETKIYDSGKNALAGNPVNAGTYTVEITDIKVYYGDVDVTNHYKFDALGATITVNKRPVTVTTQSATKEYDGTPLKNTSVESEGKIEGHTHEAKFTQDAINAGSYTNKCVSKFYADDEDVTDNYEITYVYGTLEVTRRVIRLTTCSDKKVYDGTSKFEFDDNSYSIEAVNASGEALVSGHTPSVKFTNENFNAGSHSNAATLTVKDGEGKDITRNYEIQNDFGTLLITPRPITIKSATYSWEYNGTARKDTSVEYSESELLTDDKIYVSKYTEVTYFTEKAVENVIDCRIRNKYSNGDVTDNYKITYDYGTLEITPHPITVYKRDISKAYNGEELSGEDIGIFAGLLYSGDRAVGVDITKIIDVKDGTKPNETTYEIVNAAGDIVTASYKIDYVGNATLTVMQAELSIYTPNVKRVYDGTELLGSDERYGAPPTFIGIAAGDNYRPYDATTLIDVGYKENKTQYTFYAVRNGVEVPTTDNYKIVSTVNGIVEVTPRTVRVVTDDATKEYDGSSLSSPVGNADDSTGYGLVANHRLVLDEGRGYSSIINVGEAQNVVYFKVFAGDTEVSKNYDLVYKRGTLKVTPRIVLVSTASDKTTYDAQPHSDNSKTCLHGSGTTKDNFVPDGKAPFASGQSLEITTNSFINAGEYSNDCVSFTLGGGDLSNYYLIWDIGKIIIDKRPVTITTGSGHREYNDAAYSKISATVEKDEDSEEERGLISGHYIMFDTSTVATSVTYVTEKKKKNQLAYVVYDKDDQLVTGNYDINYVWGEIYVDPLPITITTKTSSAEYDGTAYSDADTNAASVVTVGSLLTNHRLKAISYPSVTNVKEGSIENKVVYRIEKDGVDLTENYVINYKYGYISRTVRYVEVRPVAGKFTYNGEWQYKTDYTDVHLKEVQLDGQGKFVSGTADTSQKGLLDGHTLEAIDWTKLMDAVENATNTVSYQLANKELRTNYYLHVVDGTITIKPRRIIITVDGANKIYDGTPLSNPDGWHVAGEYDVDGKPLEWGLVQGHTLRADSYPSITEIDVNNISGILNYVKYTVVDGNGSAGVNGNYEIADYRYGLNDGKLTITARKITITTEGKSKTYDGTPLEWNKYSCEPCNAENTRGLLEKFGHRAEEIVTGNPPSITYVTLERGEVIDFILNARYYTITDGSRDVSHNYDIGYEYGKLIIEARPLTITTKDRSWDYDGTVHYAEEHGRADWAEFDTLVPSEYGAYWARNNAAIIDYSPEGVENTTRYDIFTAQGRNTTYCYDITYVDGTLRINRINLVITTISAKKEYDGTPLSGSDKNYNLPVFDGLIAGEKEEPFNVTEITDFGTTKNKTEYTFYVMRGSLKADTTRNYVISYIEGELEIGKRTIWVESGSAKKEYDGTPLTSIDNATADRLLTGLGHYLYVKEGEDVTITSVTDVREGSVDNEISRFWVADSKGKDISSNYNILISRSYGKLTILPRKVTIVLNTVKNFTYGDEFTGYPTQNGMFSYAKDSAETVGGQKLVITVKYQFNGEDVDVNGKLGVGRYTVVLDTKAVDGGDLDNYDVRVVNSTFEILKRKITIYLSEPENGGKEYDGEEFVFDGTINKGYVLAAGSSLAYQDELTVAVRYLLNGIYIGGSPRDVGEYTIEFDLAESFVSDGAEDPVFSPADFSYEITAYTTDYVITKRPLEFILNDIQHEYMGEFDYSFHNDLAMSFDEEQLAEIDRDGEIEVSATSDTLAIEIGKYEYYVYDFKITRSDGSNATKNYYLSGNSTAYIEIVKRKITVSVSFNDTNSREYIGTEIDLIEEYKPYGQEYGPFISAPVNEGIGEYGIFSGDLDKLTAVFTASQNNETQKLINLGTYDISVVLSDKDGYDVYKNYDIEYVDAEFLITKRHIVVTPKMTAEEQLVYDGGKLNPKYLSYDTEHFFTAGAEGFLNESDRDDYEAVYFLYEVGGNGDNLLDEVLQSGTYYLEIGLSFKYGDTREEQYACDLVESARFYVERRQLYANTPDDTTAYVYDKTEAKTPTEYTTYYYDGIWKYIDGYVLEDLQGSTPRYGYYKADRSYAKAIDAGDYDIKITSFTGATSEQTKYIRRNYLVLTDVYGLVNGRLSISRAKLVVVPISEYSEKYDGSNEIIKVPENGYTIRYGQLFGSDKLSFEASGVLDIRKSVASRVVFSKVTINDGKADVTDNYEIAYTYTQLKEVCPELVGTLNQVDFGTILSFKQRAISVRQPQAPEKYRSVEYGTNEAIKLANPDITGYVIPSGELLAGHRVEVALARAIATDMNDITQWVLRCKVVDDKGDITFGYDVTIVCGSESYIGVTRRNLTIQVPPRSQLKAGTVLKDSEYRIVDGGLYFGAAIEITVGDNGECVANVATRFGENQNDRYVVKFVYSEENNLKEAEYASRIQFLLSRRTEIIRKDDLSQ